MELTLSFRCSRRLYYIVRGQNPKHPILIPLAEWRPSDVPVFPPTPTNDQWTTATSDAHQSPLSDAQPLKPIHLSGMAPATRASRWLATRRGRVPGVRERPRVGREWTRGEWRTSAERWNYVWSWWKNWIKRVCRWTSFINLVAESRLHYVLPSKPMTGVRVGHMRPPVFLKSSVGGQLCLLGRSNPPTPR